MIGLQRRSGEYFLSLLLHQKLSLVCVQGYGGKYHPTTMNITIEELIARIERVFDHVPKPTNITMRVARGIDDYLSQEQLNELRKQDQETCWQAIPDEDLVEYGDILVFLEPDGFPVVATH